MSERSQIPSTLINLALIAGAAYVVWKYVLPRVSALPGQALTAAQSATTDFFQSVLPTPAALQPVTGSGIMLPDSSVIPLSAAKGLAYFTDTDNVIKAQFFYNGQTYRTLGAADSSGMMYAYPL